ncbi:glycosyltransferase family 39 protein [Leptolyngbya sp. KIOST-1]|uniref:glycosyltransferase family 39 protein n=1 Tax=Leptolyngbya sp. KIOST-1 TaxID=1229172 RepID=UPI0018CE6364|nr:glycosyltransferase family 39 protein [Leptolyngbya sp. KIOST-1]
MAKLFYLFFIGFFLRFFLLTNQSLWFDEGLTLDNIEASSFVELITRLRNLPHSDIFQPLYYVFLYVIRLFLGDSEFVLRGFSAILGFLVLPMLYGLARRLYGKNHSIWTLFILVFSSFLIGYSQEARNYSLLIFIASLQLCIFSEVLDADSSKKPLSRFFFAIISSIGLFCSVQSIVFTASLSFSHLLIFRKWRHWIQWWLPTAIFCLFPIVYFLTLPADANPSTVNISRFGFPIIYNAAFVIYGILVGTTYGPSQEQLRGDDKLAVVLGSWPVLLIFIAVVSVIFLLIIRLFLQRDFRSKIFRLDCFFICLAVTSFVLAIVMALITKMNLVPRHAYYLWLPLAMILPSLLHGPFLIGKVRPLYKAIARLSILFFIFLNLYSVSNYYFDQSYWRDDYRSVVRYLIENRVSGSPSVLLFGSTKLIRYYGDFETIDGHEVAWKMLSGDDYWLKSLSSVANDSKKIILVVNRKHFLEAEFPLEEKISDAYKIDYIVEDFNYFHIYYLSAI